MNKLRLLFFTLLCGIGVSNFIAPPAAAAREGAPLLEEDLSHYNWVTSPIRPYPIELAERSLQGDTHALLASEYHKLRDSTRNLTGPYVLKSEEVIYNLIGWPKPTYGSTKVTLLGADPYILKLEQVYQTPTAERRFVVLHWTLKRGVEKTLVKLDDGPWIDHTGSTGCCCTVS